MTVTKPTLYYITHPLADRDLPEQTLATFTDEDVAEYKAEYEQYRSIQNDAVREMADHIATCRDYLKVIFGAEYDCKQIKYFDRMSRGGETVTDKHAKQYIHPETSKQEVLTAREKYCNLMGSSNAPKASGEDTLQEINNACTFLMENGYALGSDFTVSNAVSIAKTVVSEKIEEETPFGEPTGSPVYNLFLNDGTEFPKNSFAYSLLGANQMKLKCVDINFDAELHGEQVSRISSNRSLTFEVSFKESSTPKLIVC